MARMRRRSTDQDTRRAPPARRPRKDGAAENVACSCEIDLNDETPIDSYVVNGGTGGYFEAKFAKRPACTGHVDCQISLEYEWTLLSATPRQPGGQVPGFRGPINGSTCNVVNPGDIKLKLDVRVRCKRPRPGGVGRISRCSDSGEAEFEVP